MNKREISNAIKVRRRVCGLTQSELASLSSVSLPLIQILEGHRGNPTLSVLERILGALEMDIVLTSHQPDWDYLERFGLTLLSPSKGRGLANATWDEQKFARELRSAVADVLASEQKDGRRKDALVGLMLALKEHYPKKAASLGLVPFFRLCKKFDGRHIKLKRLSLAVLQKFL
jgi:transcriptional regulator with XRE-family HTH domain